MWLFAPDKRARPHSERLEYPAAEEEQVTPTKKPRGLGTEQELSRNPFPANVIFLNSPFS